MGHGATLRQWLRTVAHYSTQSDGEYQPSDSGRDWMKDGGNVTGYNVSQWQHHCKRCADRTLLRRWVMGEFDDL